MTTSILTFAHECEAQLIEKKSKFLAAGQSAADEAEAFAYLESRRRLHRDAGHHCFAMRFEKSERYSDDGEPAGTAGLPILTLLRQTGICNAIVVITRYFGGVLLGTGGLTRAYGHSAGLLLAPENLIQKVRCQKLSLRVGYTLSGKIRYFIQNADVHTVRVIYDTETTFILLMRTEDVDLFLQQVTEMTNGSAVITLLEETDAVYPFQKG